MDRREALKSRSREVALKNSVAQIWISDLKWQSNTPKFSRESDDERFINWIGVKSHQKFRRVELVAVPVYASTKAL